MDNEDIKHLIDKLDDKNNSSYKRININSLIQIIFIFISLSHIFTPYLDASIVKKFNIDMRFIEIIVPSYLLFLLIKFCHLNFSYIQNRKIQLDLIKKLNVDLSIINRKNLNRIYSRQIFTEYWFRALFLKEYRFNKIPSLIYTIFIVLIISLNQSICLFFIKQYFDLITVVKLILLVSLIFTYLLYYKLLLKVFLNKKVIKLIIFLNIIFTVIIYIFLELYKVNSNI